MCAGSTCLPTPAEARALIQAGYGPRLATFKFSPHEDKLRFVGPAPKGGEGARDVNNSRCACTFFDGKDCELHALGLKPLEGRLAHHTRDWLEVREHVASTWRGKQFHSVTAALNKF